MSHPWTILNQSNFSLAEYYIYAGFYFRYPKGIFQHDSCYWFKVFERERLWWQHQKKQVILLRFIQEIPSTAQYLTLIEHLRNAYPSNKHIVEILQTVDSVSSGIKYQEEFDALLATFDSEMQTLLLELFDRLKHTRKSKRIAKSLLCKIMRQYKTVDIQKVRKGIQIYLKRRYYLEGKGEAYLWAIIRNTKLETPKISAVSQGNLEVMNKLFGLKTN